MNNMDCVMATLSRHREARGWSDEDVAADLLTQLGLDPEGEAKNAAPPPADPTMVTEADVAVAQAAAKDAADKFHAARDALHAQAEADAKDKADAAADQAKAAKDARMASAKPAPAAAAVKPTSGTTKSD